MTTDFNIIEMLSKDSSTELGDKRRTDRLTSIIQTLALNPDASFPSLFRSKSELAATYRLIENEAVHWNQIQSGHTEQTLLRCNLARKVLAIHDTTNIHFKLHDPEVIRENLVKVSSRKQGFRWHVTLAVSHSEVPTPMGVLTSQPFVSQSQLQERNDPATSLFWEQQHGVYENESQRWINAVQKVREESSTSDFEVVHVMDRESDFFGLINELTSNQDQFVLRVSHQQRTIYDEDSDQSLKISEALRDTQFQGNIDVNLGFRSPFRSLKNQAIHPSRHSRKARLSLRAKSILIKDPKQTSFQKEDLIRLNLVEVIEENPPTEKEQVHWLLWTNEPIESFEDLLDIAEMYRRRWMIEEFFKAIKSGCKLEERQFRSAHCILNSLSILSIVAWWLLGVRAMARTHLDIDWRLVITPLAFNILKRSIPDYQWQEDIQLNDVLVGIATLGGYLKTKEEEPPGWLTLMRGIQVLVQRVEGARLYVEMIGAKDDVGFV